MRTSTWRLTLLIAVIAGLALSASASASAASISCKTTGTIKLSPGLESTAKVQNISIKGTLSECSGEGSTFTGGSYVAQMKTKEAVACSALTGAGAPVEATKVEIKWSPKGGGNSGGALTMPLTELPVGLGGSISSGPFEGGTISGSVTQVYTGGGSCGVSAGKKKAKKVSKGTLSGTLAIS